MNTIDIKEEMVEIAYNLILQLLCEEGLLRSEEARAVLKIIKETI